MNRMRLHGTPPFRIAVLHGGPGAPGDAAALALKLSERRGVLEPFQSANTIEGQISELGDIIREAAEPPVILIGHSWGAMLALLYASARPSDVKSLVLVGSGPLGQEYVPLMEREWSRRFTEEEKERIKELQELLVSLPQPGNKSVFREFGRMMSKADTFQPIDEREDAVDYQPDVFFSVMSEAAGLRRTGRFRAEIGKVTCPVLAIHGDYDPHPADGVREPLSRALDDFRFILLEKCGHYPWNEVHARARFFEILERELGR